MWRVAAISAARAPARGQSRTTIHKDPAINPIPADAPDGNAASQGRIQMAMRNQLDTLPIKTNGARVSALMGPVRVAGPPTVLGYRRSTGGPVTQRAPAQEETIVEGFRGGERSILAARSFSEKYTRPPSEDFPTRMLH